MYSDSSGRSKCELCPVGSFAEGGTSTTRTGCKTCVAGSKCDGTSTLIQCGAGQYSAGGSSKCTPCGLDTTYSAANAGKCSVCPLSSFTAGGTSTSRTVCTTCAAGKSCDGSSTSTACLGGTASEEGAAPCKECGNEYSYAAAGATSCVVCDIGSYVNTKRRLKEMSETRREMLTQ